MRIFSFYFANDVGTAGVWRIAALNEAGGWKDRTTVEDMDLAVRASLKGWKFLYLANLKVLTSFIDHFCKVIQGRSEKKEGKRGHLREIGRDEKHLSYFYSFSNPFEIICLVDESDYLN